MKPAPLVYHRPRGLTEALDVLADLGADGKVLAGGQWARGSRGEEGTD